MNFNLISKKDLNFLKHSRIKTLKELLLFSLFNIIEYTNKSSIHLRKNTLSPSPFPSITFSTQRTRRNIMGRSTFENSPFENRRSLASTSLDLSPIRRVKRLVRVCIDHYHDLRQCWPPTCTHRTLINAPDFGLEIVARSL